MAGTAKSSGGNAAKVPPRPGGKSTAPQRPASRPGTYGASRGGRPVPRASARQVAQQRRQRRIYIAIGSVALVVVVVAVIIAVSLSGGGSTSNTPKANSSNSYALPASLVNQVTAVPVSKLVAVAKAEPAADTSAPQKLPAGTKALTSGGKPEILYMGAEYCPFCAGERWALVMALSKFGTFSNLRGTASSATDTNPSTPTFTFYGSTYKSNYLSFVPVELESTDENTALQNPTSQETSLLTKWDAPPYTTEAGAIPFVYLGGKYVLTGIQYDAGAISSMQFAHAASYLTSGTNPTSKALEASAGYLVGDLCTLTHGQPGSVCSKVPANLQGISASSPSGKGSSATTPTTAKTTTTKKA